MNLERLESQWQADDDSYCEGERAAFSHSQPVKRMLVHDHGSYFVEVTFAGAAEQQLVVSLPATPSHSP